MKKQKDESERFFKKVLKYERILSKKFPDISPHDLHLILRNLLRPKSWPKRFLLRRLRKDIYVP